MSTVSLYYKAAKFETCRGGRGPLPGVQLRFPAFAREQLRNLLQSIWSEQTRENADVQSRKVRSWFQSRAARSFSAVHRSI